MYIKIKITFILIAISCCLAILYSAIKFPTARAGQLYVGLLFSILIFVFIYQKIIKNIDQKKSSLDLIRPILIFNLLTLFIFYISSFELNIPSNLFRISFTFGNFMDFATMLDTQHSGAYSWIISGHYPSSYAFSKFFVNISGWGAGDAINIPRLVQLYVFIYIITLIPFYLLIRNLLINIQINDQDKILYWAFFISSYPLLVSFERGNFAFITGSLLAIYVLFYQRSSFKLCAVVIGIAASIKSLNLIFFLLLLNRFKKDELIIAVLTFISITFLSLIYLFGFNYSDWVKFVDAIFAPIYSTITLSDAAKIIATPGWDSARTFFIAMFTGLTGDQSSDSVYFKRLSMLIGTIIFGVFLYVRKGTSEWYQDGLLIVSLPLAFHSMAADYNLILLIPFLIVVLQNYKTNLNSQIFSTFSISFLLLSGYSLTWIECCGVVGRNISVSIKTVLIPYALSLGIFLILFNLIKKKSLSS